MRILVVHAPYRIRGGEDAVFENEAALLEHRGHPVATFTVNSPAQAPFQLASFRRLYRDFRPNVIHAHNLLPWFSPRHLIPLRTQGVTTVLTVHNSRLFCANGLSYRAGASCYRCAKSPWPAVAHRCYRQSAWLSLAVASRAAWLKGGDTWERAFSQIIAVAPHLGQRLGQAGIAVHRTHVVDNFVPHRQNDLRVDDKGSHFLFVGHLTEAKGVADLLEAWRQAPDLPSLAIVGDGPMVKEVTAAVKVDRRLSYLGPLQPAAVRLALQSSRALIFPSRLDEGAPMTILEALSAQTPVVAARGIGAASLLSAGRDGFFFRAGIIPELIRAVRQVRDLPATTYRDGCNFAAQKAKTRFGPDLHYNALLAVYKCGRSVT